MQTQEIVLLGNVGAGPQLSTGSIVVLVGIAGVIGYAAFAGTKAQRAARRRKFGLKGLGRATISLLGGSRRCRTAKGRFKRGC